MSDTPAVHFHARTGRCKACRVKAGLGDCEKCRKMAQALSELFRAAYEQFAAKVDAAGAAREDTA